MDQRRGNLALAAQKWHLALLDPANKLRIELFGHSRLEQSWHIAPRKLPEHLLYYVVSGEVRGTAGRKVVRVGPGEALWLAPQVQQEFLAGPVDAGLDLYHLRFALTAPGGAALSGPAPITLARGVSDLGGHIAQMFDEHVAALPHEQPRLRALLVLIMTGIARSFATQGPQAAVLRQGQRQRLMQRVEQKVAQHPTPAELAMHLNLSLDYFTRLFRRTYGQAPRRWLLQHRLRRAAQLLVESDLAIKQVAAAMGYDDLFRFSRQFKQVLGVSPRLYRRGARSSAL